MYTTSKKELSHIAILLNADNSEPEVVDEIPVIPPRRAAATTEKPKVNNFLYFFVSFVSLIIFRAMFLKNLVKNIRKAYYVN